MADDSTRLQTIADELEATYQALRSAASNIAGLLQVGRATCDEVKAYNLWALAVYNTQAGMLDAMRAGGESGVPDLPTAPTLFTWNGTAGADAWNLDCAGQPSDLSGVMARALRGPTPKTPFLSTEHVTIVTQDQHLFDPGKAPGLATLVAVQQARTQPGLGIVGIIIVIAAIAVAVSVSIVAIMHYLDVSAVQEANTQQVRLQAEAFAKYTEARLACYASCTQSGRTAEDCTATCEKLVTKPNITLPGSGGGSWGILQWVGFTVLAGGIGFAAWKIAQRRREGRPLFELPEPIHDEATLAP